MKPIRTPQQAITEIVRYCREQIEDFDMRADLAVSASWRERIPIENTSFDLADRVATCIDEWCTDNDCPTLVDDISVEDIILNS